MTVGKLVVVLVVLLALGAGIYVAVQDDGPALIPAAARTGPPAGAIFVEDSPEGIIAAVGSVRQPQRPAFIQNNFAGMWVPNEGWEGVVEMITNERMGPALRIHRPSAISLGGGVWIIALVAPDHGINVGERVWVQGSIRDVKIQSDGITVATSVVLDDARILYR